MPKSGHKATSGAIRDSEIALAQIYGFYIPVEELDDRQLKQAAAVSVLSKAGYNPSEPRIPKGEPHGGEWTAGDGGADEDAGDGGGDDDSGAALSVGPASRSSGDPGSDAGSSDHSQEPPIKNQLMVFQAQQGIWGLSPRDYLRGKSWEDQYKKGIEKLRDFGVLK